MSSIRQHIGDLAKDLECKKQTIKLFIFNLHYIAQNKVLQLKPIMKVRSGSKA